MSQSAATFRTARCATCGMIYFGVDYSDAGRQHDLVEGHELAVPPVSEAWTQNVFVEVTDSATGAPVTDINEVARVLGLHCALDDYAFEIEADDANLGLWLVTVPADSYATASEEGGLTIEIAGFTIDIPMI